MKVFTLLLLVALASCGIQVEKKSKKKEDEKVSTHTSRKVIGRDDLLPVDADGLNIPEKYRTVIDAVGKISTEFMGNCTGVHVGNGIVVTAGHCFAAFDNEMRNINCPGTVVRWGFRKNGLTYSTSKCVKILSQRHGKDIDYSIFLVEPIPAAKVEVNFESKPELKKAITIFSHPKGRRLEWSDVCTVQSAADDEKLGANHFYHACDSEPASSGAPIFDDETLELIGIHNGSRHMLPWNYGSFLFGTPLGEFLESQKTF